MPDSLNIVQTAAGVELAVKVIPNASRNQIVGPLGDALKIKVAAPPESGKANAAVCDLLAQSLGVSPRAVTVIAGHTHTHKRLAIAGVTAEQVRKRLR